MLQGRTRAKTDPKTGKGSPVLSKEGKGGQGQCEGSGKAERDKGPAIAVRLLEAWPLSKHVSSRGVLRTETSMKSKDVPCSFLKAKCAAQAVAWHSLAYPA